MVGVKDQEIGILSKQEIEGTEIEQVEKVHEGLFDPQFIEHQTEDPEISEEMREVGIYSNNHQATSVIKNGPTIVLPINQIEIKQGLKNPVFNTLRWLAVWCMRVIAMAKKRRLKVVFENNGSKI